MKIKFPRIPPSLPATERYFRDHDTVVDRELQARTPDLEGRNSLLLVSPDRSVWEITVDDAGAISAAKVQGT